uniref:Uncharacterized protein n=1 Tax=Rhizophora mucronata TaxID=61149 RepID=A0A2P2P5G1_RHIMU
MDFSNLSPATFSCSIPSFKML